MSRKHAKQRPSRRPQRASAPPASTPPTPHHPSRSSAPADGPVPGPVAASLDSSQPGEAPPPVESSIAEPVREAAPATTSADDEPHDPGRDAQGERHDAKREDPGTEPGEHDAAREDPDAAQQPAVKADQAGEQRTEDHDGDRGEPGDGAEGRASHDSEGEQRKPKARGSSAHDDGLHEEFFRRGEEVDREHIAAFDAAVNADRPGQPSDTPVTRAVPLDPMILERRARFRKMVAWALVPAAIIAVIAGARLVSKAESSAGANHSSAAGSPKPPNPLTTNVSRPASASGVVPVLSAPSAGVSAAPERSAAASAGPAVSQPPPEPAADVAATRKQVLKLLNQGKFKDALPLAQSAVAADPSDAELYLYEGTALEELGRRKEAIESYSRCVHQATKGPVHECRALGGK